MTSVDRARLLQLRAQKLDIPYRVPFFSASRFAFKRGEISRADLLKTRREEQRARKGSAK